MNIRDQYPDIYKTLVDDETWEFIERTNEWYPPEAIDWPIERTRENYDAMCRAFSAGYPEGVEVETITIDHVFGKIPARLYAYKQPNLAAAVIYLHGGGYVVGGLESHDDVCAEICQQTGLSVVSVDYRLAPEHHFPSDFIDAQIAFETMGREGLPLILVGDSAGANLVAAVSHQSRARSVLPIGQVLIYPALGSRFDRGSFIKHANAPLLSTEETQFYKSMRTNSDLTMLENPKASPLNDENFENLPPTVIFSAECDPLYEDGREYSNRLHAAGTKVQFIPEAGLVHGYLRARHSVLRAQQSFQRITQAISMLASRDWIF